MSEDEHRVDAMDNASEPFQFRYETPQVVKGKKAVRLVRTEWAQLAVQVLREGGENNLHSHAHVEGHYFVLKGHVRFYTAGNVLIAELGPHEGVVIPRGYPYWFEANPQEADEVLEIMRFGSFDERSTPQSRFFNRTNLEPLKPNQSATLETRGTGAQE